MDKEDHISMIYMIYIYIYISFTSDSDSKESACNAGDVGLIPGLRRSPREGNDTHSSILAWRIPWTEEPGGLQSMALQRITLAQRHSREDKPHSTNLCVVLRKAQ